MIDDPALINDQASDVATIEGLSVYEMLGELLGWVAGHLERRLGGPGALRRLVSVLAAFVTVVVTLAVRLRTAAQRPRALAATSPLHRHLSHPPAGWAAP